MECPTIEFAPSRLSDVVDDAVIGVAKSVDAALRNSYTVFEEERFSD